MVRTKIVSVLLVALLGAVFIRLFLVEGFIVRGDSMAPNILSGDYVFISKLAYLNKEPSHGDIIIASPRKSKIRIIKRVIGLPGEYVEINSKEFKLDPQEYFVVGDNKEASIDSRDLGFIDKWHIKGKAVSLFRIKSLKYIGL